jgi:hypothetical protein
MEVEAIQLVKLATQFVFRNILSSSSIQLWQKELVVMHGITQDHRK